MKRASDLELSALLGVAAGMRTTAPIVAMAADPQRAWWAFIGELCADKLPFTPARTGAGATFGRVVTSVWAGFELAAQRKSPFLQAATAAGVSAIVATNLFYETRRYLTTVVGLPDILVALAEDACALRIIMHLRSTRGASACR